MRTKATQIEESQAAFVQRTDVEALCDRLEFYKADSGKSWEDIDEEICAPVRTGVIATIAPTRFAAHIAHCFASHSAEVGA